MSTGWRGWQHDRWVYFYHDEGPIVVLDEASGPAAGRGELIWHLPGYESDEGSRILTKEWRQTRNSFLCPWPLRNRDL